MHRRQTTKSREDNIVANWRGITVLSSLGYRSGTRHSKAIACIVAFGCSTLRTLTDHCDGMHQGSSTETIATARTWFPIEETLHGGIMLRRRTASLTKPAPREDPNCTNITVLHVLLVERATPGTYSLLELAHTRDYKRVRALEHLGEEMNRDKWEAGATGAGTSSGEREPSATPGRKQTVSCT